MIKKEKNTQAETNEVIEKIVRDFDCELIVDIHKFQGERKLRHVKQDWIKEKG